MPKVAKLPFGRRGVLRTGSVQAFCYTVFYLTSIGTGGLRKFSHRNEQATIFAITRCRHCCYLRLAQLESCRFPADMLGSLCRNQ